MTFFGVYAHLKPDGIPFYIGKTKNSRGSTQRCYEFKKRNQYHKNTVAKYGAKNILIEIMPCKSESEAFLREQLAIKALRAAGIRLCNMTDGGDGSIGCIPSLSTKAKMSKAYTPRTSEQIAKWMAAGRNSKRFTGMKHSPETREKMSAWQIGKKHSAETKARISATKIKRNAERKLQRPA